MTKTQVAKWDTSEFLETEEDIAAYLAVAFEEGDPDMIALTIGNVAKARGMTEIAQRTGVSRDCLYRSFRKGSSLNLSTLIGVMNTFGLKLTTTV
jgi:probable addiction module antidote protein